MNINDRSRAVHASDVPYANMDPWRVRTTHTAVINHNITCVGRENAGMATEKRHYSNDDGPNEGTSSMWLLGKFGNVEMRKAAQMIPTNVVQMAYKYNYARCYGARITFYLGGSIITNAENRRNVLLVYRMPSDEVSAQNLDPLTGRVQNYIGVNQILANKDYLGMRELSHTGFGGTYRKDHPLIWDFGYLSTSKCEMESYSAMDDAEWAHLWTYDPGTGNVSWKTPLRMNGFRLRVLSLNDTGFVATGGLELKVRFDFDVEWFDRKIGTYKIIGEPKYWEENYRDVESPDIGGEDDDAAAEEDSQPNPPTPP